MNRMKQLREEMQKSKAQVAREMNMPYTTYVNYEKGAREPNSELLIMIATYFGVSIDYLIGRSENRLPQSIIATNLTPLKQFVPKKSMFYRKKSNLYLIYTSLHKNKKILKNFKKHLTMLLKSSII